MFTRLLSENAMWDTITALGLMICFYYGITAVACIWYFRTELLASPRNVAFKLVCPLVGGGFLLAMFAITAMDSLDPDYGSGTSVFGVGTVFVLGMSILALGVVLMIFTRIAHPAFFKGRTLRRISSATDKPATARSSPRADQP